MFDFLEPSKAVGLFLFAACTFTALFLQSIFPVIAIHRWMIWGFSLFWILDLLSLPFLLVYRTPNGYLNEDLRVMAGILREKAGHQRFLSLQVASNLRLQGKRIDDGFETRLSMNFLKDFVPNTNVPWGLRSAGAYLSLIPDNNRNLDRYFTKGFPYKGDLLDIAGVRVLLLPQPLPNAKYERAGELSGNIIHLNPRASEDLRWVPRTRVFESRPAILEQLAQPGNPWRKFVYLDQSPDGRPSRLKAAIRSLKLGLDPGEDVSSFSRRSFNGHFTGSGYVAFNENYTPGWHAWLDNAPTPIFRAYGLFMAVEVPEGMHQVEFRYEPTSFRLGLFISLLALTLLGSAAGIHGFRTGTKRGASSP